MKKIFLLALTVIMVISFTACAGIPFFNQFGQQTAQTTQPVYTQNPYVSSYPQVSESPASAEGEYQIINGNVVKTIYTGDIKQVFTYYYQYGSIVGADIVSTCSSSIEAQAMYDIFMQTNESSSLYETVEMNGNVVTVSYDSIAIAAYSGMTAQELKEYLEVS